MEDPDKRPDIIEDLREEVSGMAKQGLDHPGSKQVITGAVLGAVAGGVLPVVTWPIGLIAGIGIVLYTRVRK